MNPKYLKTFFERAEQTIYFHTKLGKKTSKIMYFLKNTLGLKFF